MIIILTSSSSSSPRIYSGAQALEEEYLTYSETLPYIPSIKDLSLSKTSAQVITSPTRVWVLMRKDRNDGEEIVKKLKCNLSLVPLIKIWLNDQPFSTTSAILICKTHWLIYFEILMTLGMMTLAEMMTGASHNPESWWDEKAWDLWWWSGDNGKRRKRKCVESCLCKELSLPKSHFLQPCKNCCFSFWPEPLHDRVDDEKVCDKIDRHIFDFNDDNHYRQSPMEWWWATME